MWNMTSAGRMVVAKVMAMVTMEARSTAACANRRLTCSHEVQRSARESVDLPIPEGSAVLSAIGEGRSVTAGAV